jgi:putative hydrolase of the HAD superfamily
MGKRVGLLSNASDVENVERLMAAAGLDGRFDPVVISAAVGMRKPTPTLFLDIVRGWELDPGSAVMVGDMLAEDILGAQRAGLHQIWVRGEADPAFNDEHLDRIHPEIVVDSLDAVPDSIKSLETQAPA